MTRMTDEEADELRDRICDIVYFPISGLLARPDLFNVQHETEEDAREWGIAVCAATLMALKQLVLEEWIQSAMTHVLEKPCTPS